MNSTQQNLRIRKGFIIPLVLLVIALLAGGGFYLVRYMANNGRSFAQAGTPVASSTEATTSALTSESEVVFTGGDAQLPECFVEHTCKDIQIRMIFYIPNGIDSPYYVISKVFDKGRVSYYAKRGSYLRWGESDLIRKEDYNALFPGNEISSSTIMSATSDVHDFLREFDETDGYLFDLKEVKMTSVDNLSAHLINTSVPNGWFNDVVTFDSLETIRRMKINNPTAFAGLPDDVVPYNSPLVIVDVVYESAIENNKIIPKRKIYETDFFQNKTSTNIQL